MAERSVSVSSRFKSLSTFHLTHMYVPPALTSTSPPFHPSTLPLLSSFCFYLPSLLSLSISSFFHSMLSPLHLFYYLLHSILSILFQHILSLPETFSLSLRSPIFFYTQYHIYNYLTLFSYPLPFYHFPRHRTRPNVLLAVISWAWFGCGGVGVAVLGGGGGGGGVGGGLIDEGPGWHWS